MTDTWRNLFTKRRKFSEFKKQHDSKQARKRRIRKQKFATRRKAR